MARRNLGRQKAGAPIRAAWLNEIADAAGVSLNVGAGLNAKRTNGVTAITLADPTVALARLTGGGTGGKYSWQEVRPDTTPGVFTDAYLVGTTTFQFAYEVNGNINVPVGTRVLLRNVGTYWIFQTSVC